MNKKQQSEDKFVPMGTKISPAASEVWNSICDSIGTDTYHMLQNFIYTMIRAAADPHALNPDIQKILRQRSVRWCSFWNRKGARASVP